MDELNQEIYEARQFVENADNDPRNRLRYLGLLSMNLHTRYQQMKSVRDLEDAIRFTQQGIEGLEDSEPRRFLMQNLGIMLNDKYQETGLSTDLDALIAVTTSLAPDVDPNSTFDGLSLHNIGALLRASTRRQVAPEDRDRAITAGRLAVNTVSQNHPDHPTYLQSLGNQHHERFQSAPSDHDIEQAITLTRQAVEATPSDDEARYARLSQLGFQLHAKFEFSGGPSDLAEAIDTARDATKTIPSSDPLWTKWISNLGALLSHRARETGTMGDLEEAIVSARKAIEVTSTDSSDNIEHLDLLANHLHDRYNRFGALADLEESINLLRQVVETSSSNHARRAEWFDWLALRHYETFQRNHEIKDIAEAVSYARKAADATPKGDLDRTWRLSNLAMLLRDSGVSSVAVLEEAIAVAQDAANVAPDPSAQRSVLLANLALRLYDKYKQKGDTAGLDEAIRVARQAADATPSGLSATRGRQVGERYPDRAVILRNLGIALDARFERDGNKEDLDASTKCYREALYSTSSTMDSRINAGRLLLAAPSALERGDTIYSDAKAAVDLIPLSAPRSLKSTDKRHNLSRAVGIASDAAAISLSLGKEPLLALELLESGRGVLASSIQDIRTDVFQLRKDHPNLAKDFEQLRHQLDSPKRTKQLDIPSGTSVETHADERHQAHAEMERLLGDIRSQPSFERFLLPPTEQEMCQTARSGPIIIINVSRHRCDAIIIDQSRIHSFQLQELSFHGIVERIPKVQSEETLRWLWKVIVGPVLDAQGLKTTPDADNWPRVWWIPTGPLTLFPLHAAGYHDTLQSTTAIDRVISSYSPSVKAIINTRRSVYHNSKNKHVVLVPMDHTPQLTRLRFPNREVNAVASLCMSHGIRPLEPDPEREEVLDALVGSSMFHFAGHGGTDPVDPLQSCLYLRDWEQYPMTVGSLLETNLSTSAPFLAYLSACGTGQNLDATSVDESIHLAIAFQLAGFRHVIGTLWEVNDAMCVEIAERMYEFLLPRGFDDASVSTGLHLAVRALRDQWVRNELLPGRNDEGQRNIELRDMEPTLGLWVPYVHYGV
ncbi:hypothetical protein FAUST_11406 [Fusarium austroamericanum]|uniref:CHAT domain-containing protein n=1 Tax=Fusarium austroamericanum TaxID=282268 RepID=A0AAN6BUC1_FUSAU|nr:hypothetical protein FAUST_11406 [Fusarium austroamericanum]